MRLVAAAAALALALAVPQAGAAQTLAPQAAGVGEVLLEVDAIGLARTQADVATLFVTITCKGATLAEANARNEALVTRFKVAARGAGIAEADVIVTSHPLPPMSAELSGNGGGTEVTEGTGNHSIRTTIEMRLRDLGRWEQLRRALLAAGAPSVGNPTYSLGDDRAARMAAKLDAVGRARADAQAYAAKLGMRVGRIVRVSDRARTDFADVGSMQEMFRSMRDEGRSDTREIETRAKVSVDFILLPRS